MQVDHTVEDQVMALFQRVKAEQGRLDAHYAAPLMMDTGPGLIVEITDGDSFWYRGNIFYDLVKSSVIRLAFAMARELRKSNIRSLSLTPGFLRFEAMLERFGVTEADWQEGAK